MTNNYTMFSFFIKKEPVVRVPQWSRLANASEYTAFKRAVQHHFKDTDVRLNFTEGTAHFGQAALFPANAINLISLYKLCLANGNSDSFLLTIDNFMRSIANAGNSGQNFQILDAATNRPSGLRLQEGRL